MARVPPQHCNNWRRLVKSRSIQWQAARACLRSARLKSPTPYKSTYLDRVSFAGVHNPVTAGSAHVRRRVENWRAWAVFAAWLAVGASYSFALLDAVASGVFVLPFAVIATIVVAKLTRGWSSLFGTISGFGVPVLYVAWLNRSGPGNVCVAGPSSMSCGQERNPFPWLVTGLALLAIGGLTFVAYENARARNV